MAKTLSTTNISTGFTIQPEHILQIIKALTQADDYDINISGSLSLLGPLLISGTSSLEHIINQGDLINSGSLLQSGSVSIIGNQTNSGSVSIIGNQTNSGSINISGSINLSNTFADYAYVNIPANNLLTNKPSFKLIGGNSFNSYPGAGVEIPFITNNNNQGVIFHDSSTKNIEIISSNTVGAIQKTTYIKLDKTSLAGKSTGASLDLLDSVTSDGYYGNKFLSNNLLSTNIKPKNIRFKIEGYLDTDTIGGNSLDFSMFIGSHSIPFVNSSSIMIPTFNPVSTPIPYVINMDLLLQGLLITSNSNIELSDPNNFGEIYKLPITTWNDNPVNLAGVSGPLVFRFNNTSNVNSITSSYAQIEILN